MHRHRSWPEKFRVALRGVWLTVRSERSFAVHLPMTAAVAVGAIVLRVNLVEACLLVLCVTIVIAAETFNTALEQLAREVDREHNVGIAAALDIGSGAVLVAALGSAIVGCAVFGYRLGLLLAWWG